MRNNIQKTIDKFMKKKNQMINSLQNVKTKNAKDKKKKKEIKDQSLKISSKANNSIYNSKRSGTSKPKKNNNKKKQKNGKKKKSRNNSINLNKKQLKFYESEKKKNNRKHLESTRIKTEAESIQTKNNTSQKFEDLFAPLIIKRTHIDSGRNTGLLCKICLDRANQETKLGKGVHIPQCTTINCVNNPDVPSQNLQDIDEKLDQAFEESMMEMESEILEKGFGKGFDKSSEESDDNFINIKESSVINEEIEKIGSEQNVIENKKELPKFFVDESLELTETNPAFLNTLSESDNKEVESKKSEEKKKIIKKAKDRLNFLASDSSEEEKEEISIKENTNFGMLLSLSLIHI